MTSVGMPGGQLNRASPVPLYYQLAEMLRAKINAGDYDSDGQFPSERELVERYRISRMTARQALSELVREGLIIREQGRGSSVVRPRIQDQLRHLTSFTEDMQLRGLPTSAKIVDLRVVTDESVALKMDVPTSEEFVRLQRIRFVKKEPIALQTAFVLHRFCPNLAEEGLIGESLYKTLEERYGLHLGRALQTIGAKLSDGYDKEMFGVDTGQPMLSLERLTYLVSGEPIEYVRSTYRGDLFRFTVELQR
ncbi:MAG: GntR family transcriptional regulator [Deltaproteobacteria bacterium]|nr:MAG: GntR family transcriptional regulator [Deltaproteobacteria bacterium]